ncbi:MAG TPA: PEP/pyruvate-binding domain-containing protein [Trueperaceae bacterium]|nr:PEP/pyruvate-binding domain-containing protein [Trueperaceae bacterium]
MSTPLVVGLRDLGRGDLAVAGGKGANLGELLRAGFPVPDGFVVTTHAYALAAERAGLSDASIAARLVSGTQGAAALRADLEAVTVPEEVAAAVTAARVRLGGGPVAVRSSATAEDLPGAAFAGQQDTYLNVVGEQELLAAVRRCWASLWTDRAVSYRERRGVGHGPVQIAVVVQRLVDAASAGVMFTANPVTGDRHETVVDASVGLGEAVVSGLVTPDHYLLDEHGRILDWSPGRREVVIRAAEGGGVAHDRSAANEESRDDASRAEELARRLRPLIIFVYDERPAGLERCAVDLFTGAQPESVNAALFEAIQVPPNIDRSNVVQCFYVASALSSEFTGCSRRKPRPCLARTLGVPACLHHRQVGRSEHGLPAPGDDRQAGLLCYGTERGAHD